MTFQMGVTINGDMKTFIQIRDMTRMLIPKCRQFENVSKRIIEQQYLVKHTCHPQMMSNTHDITK